MPILKWLFKGGQEQAKEPTITRSSNKQTASATVQKPDCKDLVLYKGSDSIYQRSTRNEKSEMECKNNSDSTLKVLMDRRNPKTCFYSTLNLKKLGRFGNSNHSWLRRVMKEEEAAHVNDKGLSISSNATTVPTLASEQCGSIKKKDKPKPDKTKPISRMKELLRWAASSKAEKGGGKYTRKALGYPNSGAIKAAAHDDESSLSSSKIDCRWDVGNCSSSSSAKINSRWDVGSCSTSSSAQINSRWDVGNCSTSSSAFSGFSSYTSSSARSDQLQIKPIISSVAEDASAPDSNEKEATTSSQEPERCTSRRGNWITNDDLFVVLEL